MSRKFAPYPTFLVLQSDTGIIPLRPPTSRQESNPRPPRNQPHTQSPQVGIWRDNGKIIVAIAHPPTENTTRTGNGLDSNLSHADEWGQVARKLGRTTEDEYYSVPRGRVLLDLDSQTGIILHGPGTTRQRLALVARRFGLRDWQGELDAHYSTGENVDRRF